MLRLSRLLFDSCTDFKAGTSINATNCCLAAPMLAIGSQRLEINVAKIADMRGKAPDFCTVPRIWGQWFPKRETRRRGLGVGVEGR
ncbi:hypothetical protein CCP4SC76_2580010 [Gammaproteobacteria bacterium]